MPPRFEFDVLGKALTGGETADMDPFGRIRPPEHDAVITGFRGTARIQSVLILVADEKAKKIDIEGAAFADAFDL